MIVGRPRDGNDRIAWLSERRRFSEALAVAEGDWSVTAVRETRRRRPGLACTALC